MIRRALRRSRPLATAALLATIGGTALLLLDDQILAALRTGLSLALVVKAIATYAALFAGSLFAAADWGALAAALVRDDRR